MVVTHDILCTVLYGSHQYNFHILYACLSFLFFSRLANVTISVNLGSLVHATPCVLDPYCTIVLVVVH